jgi:uncharacterized repeat protein (TIGR01451 family)
MRTLSEVFGPGAPTLPEGLRTLVVSPDRELEPGMTVRATFTFRNHGGAPATGVRVRFNLAEGLIYLVGSGKLDGSELDDELGNSPLLARSGADVGDVLPGEERRIEIAYSVAGAIENGTTIELQAAVASFELAPVGSNIVRLIARSKPQLQNALTSVAIEARHDPVPGSEAQVTIRIHNAGESSAHDVVVVAPIPEHTTYLAASARINGRELERDLGARFDRVYAPVVIPALAASASATIVYRIRIDVPLRDGTSIVAQAGIASQETPVFEPEPALLTVTAAPDFGDDRTSFCAEPEQDVAPGARVGLTLTAYNGGTAAAERVTAAIELPEALVLVRGASSVDGRPVRERRKEPLLFDLGCIGVGEAVSLRSEAVVLAPLPDGTALTAIAVLAWEPASQNASRRLERAIAVRSEPALPARRNALVRCGGALARPGDELEANIELANDGSAAAHDGVLHLRVDPALDDVRVFDRSQRLRLDGPSTGSGQADTVDLGTIESYSARRLTLRARVRSPYADRSEIHLGASLHTRELGETPLGEAIWVVDSHPAFNARTSALELADDAVLRPNQLADVDLLVTNVGTDTAHNVRLRIYVSPEARLESVDGAIRERSSLLFGEIASGTSAKARLGLRLLRSLAKEYPVTVDAVLTADAMLPVPLERLTIATSAEPDFSIGTFRSDPLDTVDVGETVEWMLHVRNGGDGLAHRVQIAIEQPETLIYVPNSTTVNGVPVRDVGALAPFAAPRGIVLNDVDPGVEATVRWRDVVHNELPAGEPIARVAHVRYDGGRDDEIAAGQLRARAEPAFANAIPGLPFGLDGMLGPAFGADQRALGEERFVQLPPATPVGTATGIALFAQLTSGGGDGFSSSDSAAVYDGAVLVNRVGTSVTFSTERFERTLRFLDEARFGGLVTHLFALRAFLPDAVGDAHGTALATLRDRLREELDRLFIKLRLPNYVIAARDVETPSLRSTIERVLHEASAARGMPSDPPSATTVLRGTFDPSELRDLAERLPESELASALPWAALARLLPDAAAPCAQYRAALIEQLDALADSGSQDFIEALQRRQDEPLQAALDALRASLYSGV